VTGRWGYATGIHHAPYALVPALVEDGTYWFVIPREQLEIGDDWDVGSMAATGSVTIATKDTFVADGWGQDIQRLVSATNHGGISHPEKVYHYPFSALSIAVSSIGLGALDRAVELCRAKLETSRPYGIARIDRSLARLRWTKAFQDARVARYVRDAALEQMVAQCDGLGPPRSLATDALNSLNGMSLQQLTKEAARSLLDGFGTSGFKADDQVRRLTGDIAMMATHVLGGDYDVMMERHSRLVLGLGPAPGDPQLRLA
jgi:alkylation response protein AidB-like acyl-CoA dehydrogenase